jgi:hypothetical protein
MMPDRWISSRMLSAPLALLWVTELVRMTTALNSPHQVRCVIGINVGGNLAVGPGGVNDNNSVAPYFDTDGGATIRLINPCTDDSCTWSESGRMLQRRWYPTCETLDDGSIIILGGDQWGGL